MCLHFTLYYTINKQLIERAPSMIIIHDRIHTSNTTHRTEYTWCSASYEILKARVCYDNDKAKKTIGTQYQAKATQTDYIRVQKKITANGEKKHKYFFFYSFSYRRQQHSSLSTTNKRLQIQSLSVRLDCSLDYYIAYCMCCVCASSTILFLFVFLYFRSFFLDSLLPKLSDCSLFHGHTVFLLWKFFNYADKCVSARIILNQIDIIEF